MIVKKLLFCIALLTLGLSFTGIYAQENSPTKQTNNGTEPAFPLVSFSYMNVVYMGVDNPIEVAVPDVPRENIVVELVSDSGNYPGEATITPVAGEPGHYLIRPTKNGIIYIRVGVKDVGNTVRYVGTQVIRIKRIPAPTIMLGSNKAGSTIPKEDFERLHIRVVIPDFDFMLSEPLRIYRFEFSVSGSDRQPVVVEGGSLGPEQIAMIKNAKKTSKVYFSTKVNTPDGVLHHIDVSYNIK